MFSWKRKKIKINAWGDQCFLPSLCQRFLLKFGKAKDTEEPVEALTASGHLVNPPPHSLHLFPINHFRIAWGISFSHNSLAQLFWPDFGGVGTEKGRESTANEESGRRALVGPPKSDWKSKKKSEKIRTAAFLIPPGPQYPLRPPDLLYPPYSSFWSLSSSPIAMVSPL